ncbi:DUF58 domain-containing protein [Archaeoglobus sp.]
MLVKNLVKTAMFLIILGLLSTSKEIVSSALIPILILAVPHFVTIRGYNFKRSSVEFVGDVMNVEIALNLVGFGIVNVRHILPNSFEIVEGSNTVNSFVVGMKNVSMRYAVRVKKAGLYKLNNLTVEVINPLNTWRSLKKLTLNVEVEVKPKVRKIVRIATERTKAKSPIPDIDVAKIGSPGTDFKEIREYNHEPMKFINWKATAKTGSLKVNVFEVEGKKTIWFFVDANLYMENVLDFTIDLTSSLAYHFAKRGHKIGMYLVGLREVLYPDVGVKQFRRILERLSRVECGEESLMSAFEFCKPYLYMYKPYVILITRVEYSKPVDFRSKLLKMGLKGFILNIKKDFGSDFSREIVELVRNTVCKRVKALSVDADKDVSLALARLVR